MNDRSAGLDASGKRVAIIVSRFNDYVTERLLGGAAECLMKHGVADNDIDVYRVAGAFELPQIAARVSRDRKADGIVCVGALIRGETLHFEVLANAVCGALETLGTTGKVPVAFGVLTVDTLEQAIERAGGKHGNAGWSAALSLIEMMNLWEE